jgi:hypothetical protein
VAKDNKNTNKDKAKRSASSNRPSARKTAKTGKTKRRLKAIADNPVVGEIIAAALVGAAAALKDSKKARQLASHAGDEIEKLSKEGAQRGNALWEMALDIGRRSLDQLGSDSGKTRSKKPAKGEARRASPKK